MPLVKRNFKLTENSHVLGFLCRVLGKKPSFVQRLFDTQKVFLDGVVLEDKSYRGKGFLEIIIFEPACVKKFLEPIFAAQDFALFDKPAFMLSHPNDRSDKETLLDSICHHFGSESGLCHRLDYETSGLVMVYQRKNAEAALKALFEKRCVQKTYEALVCGDLKNDTVVETPLMYSDELFMSKHRSYPHRLGKSAKTTVKVLRQMGRKTLVEVRPETGRIHQIRVHLHSIGHPLVGEPIYGRSFKEASDYLDGGMDETARQKQHGAKRVMLHAKRLAFAYRGINYVIESKRSLLDTF